MTLVLLPIHIANKYKLIVFWCIFPSNKDENEVAPFQTSEYFLCIYPSMDPLGFREMFNIKLFDAARSPGKTMALSTYIN